MGWKVGKGGVGGPILLSSHLGEEEGGERKGKKDPVEKKLGKKTPLFIRHGT